MMLLQPTLSMTLALALLLNRDPSPVLICRKSPSIHSGMFSSIYWLVSKYLQATQTGKENKIFFDAW